MPVDEDGIRAEMLIDMSSPVSRNNPAQLYETGINRISEFVRRKVQTVYDATGVDDAFEVLVDWFQDVNRNYAQITRETCVTTREKKELVLDAISTGIKLWIPPFLDTLTPTPDEQWNALINIRNWAKKWGARRSKIKWKTPQPDGSLKEFTSLDPFAIGSKYVYHLNKLPEVTAPGPAAVNHIGVPTKVTMNNKYFPVSNNPYRFGEDELRIMCMDADVREVTRFQNLMSNSPKGTSLAIETLLLSEKPSAIKRFPISNGDLIKSSVILNLFHGVTATLGVETKRTRIEPGEREVSDDLTDSIWEAESIDKDGADDLPGENSVSADRVMKKRAKMTLFLGTQDEELSSSTSDDTDDDD